MKRQLTVLILFVTLTANLNANMASPIREGALGGLTFINSSVDVISETINIQPNQDFSAALVEVVYTIHSDSSSYLIPIIFHAEDYQQGFELSFDGRKVDLADCFPAYYNHLEQVGLPDFATEVLIQWEYGRYLSEELNDLKYFEVDITGGIHTINVSYYANAWENLSDWVKIKSIQYSLSPIKYWKSVGDISLTLDLSKVDLSEGTITTNLDKGEQREITKMHTWKITDLKEEYVKIAYQAKPSIWSSLLIRISPLGLGIIAFLLLATAHIWLIWRWRKKEKTVRKFNVYGGGITVPVLAFLLYMAAFGLIDQSLGDNASGYHGYVFLVVLLLPFLILLYVPIVASYNKSLR